MASQIHIPDSGTIERPERGALMVWLEGQSDPVLCDAVMHKGRQVYRIKIAGRWRDIVAEWRGFDRLGPVRDGLT